MTRIIDSFQGLKSFPQEYRADRRNEQSTTNVTNKKRDPLEFAEICRAIESLNTPPLGDEVRSFLQGETALPENVFHRFAKDDLFEALLLLKKALDQSQEKEDG